MNETKGEYIAMKPGFKKPEVGWIVAVDAVDWGIYDKQYPPSMPFAIAHSTAYGKVVEINDEFIALAFQVVHDGGMRYVLSIPWRAVDRVTVLLDSSANEP